MKTFSLLDKIVLVLIIVGAFNLGALGLFYFDIFNLFFNRTICRVIYTVIGLAGIWAITFPFRLNQELNQKEDA
ncbi:MAG: DUF378 domain-containing protein [Bacillota bacterium]|jgi:uncharacterized membrane protein YuzA (DUF378 family)